MVDDLDMRECDDCKKHDLMTLKVESNCKALSKLSDKVDVLEKMETHFEYIQADLSAIKKDCKELKVFMETHYVPIERFKLVEKVVYTTAFAFLVCFIAFIFDKVTT